MAQLCAKIFSGTSRNISRLARELRSGGIVAVPTETVYGLAANALDTGACRRVFRVKGRPASDPLIVHIHALAEMSLLGHVNSSALLLARKFWPGPLTLVLRKRKIVPAIVTAGKSSVAIRMPAHPVMRRLLRASGLPLAAPSANPFGYVSPTTAEHVRAELGSKIPSILDGGRCTIGLESSIVDVRDPARPRLLRPGAISKAQLERVLGRPVRYTQSVGRADVAQLAPGMLTRHYSPRTPVVLHADLSAARRDLGPECAWVFVAKPRHWRGRNVFWLDAKGDLRRAARSLFSMLRKLDRAGFRELHFECPRSEEGIAAAICDRLQRAAARS